MVKIVETEPDPSGVFNILKLKLGDVPLDSQKVLRRPISKTVLLVEDESVAFPR